MSSSDERAPLVYSLHVDNSVEDPLGQRSSSVTNGATAILSRLPSNLNPPWRALAGVFGLLVVTVTVVLIMYFFTTALVPAAFPIPHSVSKRSLEHCDSNEIDTEAPWNNLQPLETQMKFVKDRRRIFFVKRQGDNLTAANVCALKSAGRVGRVFLIVLVPAMTMTDETAAVDEIREAGLDREVDVMVADPARYFSGTPLSGYGADDGSRRRELQDFAVKVVTLWRFGGAAYDLDIVTLKHSAETRPRSDIVKHSPGIEPTPVALTGSTEIKPLSAALEPGAALNEDVAVKLSSSIEPPRATLKTSPGLQLETKAFEPFSSIEPPRATLKTSPGLQLETKTFEPSSSREPLSVTLAPKTVSVLETLTLNRSINTESRSTIEFKSTWQNITKSEPMVATLTLPTGNERYDSRATSVNYSSTEKLYLTLKPTIDTEPDTVAFKLAGIESQPVALNHSPEVELSSATLTAPPPLEAQIVALNHPPGPEPRALVDGNATISEDGAILVAHQPCHAFVFAVMRALAVLDPLGTTGSEDARVSKVVQSALQSFCGPDLGSCNGVKVVSEDRLCVGAVDEGGRCEWTRVGGGFGDFDWNGHCL